MRAKESPSCLRTPSYSFYSNEEQLFALTVKPRQRVLAPHLLILFSVGAGLDRTSVDLNGTRIGW